VVTEVEWNAIAPLAEALKLRADVFQQCVSHAGVLCGGSRGIYAPDDSAEVEWNAVTSLAEALKLRADVFQQRVSHACVLCGGSRGIYAPDDSAK
jgi:predicted kinase